MGAVRWCAVVVVLLWFATLSGYDLRYRRLPNALTVPGAVAVWCGACLYGRGLTALAGAVALGLLYLSVHLLVPGGLGAGDVKLALGIGALTGAFGVDVWALSTILAPLLTGVLAVVVVALRAGRTVPHGPSMCLAATAAVAAALG